MSAIFEWVPEPGTLGLFEWLEPGWLGAIEWVDGEPVFDTSTHATARAAVIEGFEQFYGRKPTLRQAQFAQAVTLFETGYGTGWKKMCEKYSPLCCDGINSFNMGAIQKKLPPCDDESFLCRDKKANGEVYEVCFRKYPSMAAGFAGQIKILYGQRPKVLAVASNGSIREFAEAMRASTYYVATSDVYTAGLEASLKRITSALGEQMPPVEPAAAPTSGTKLVLWAAVAGAAGYAAWRFLPGVRALVLA